jgi:hypothetical protein
MTLNRRHLALGAGATLAAISLGAPAHAEGKAKDEASVTQAVEAFRVAMQKSDKAQFEALCSNQLSYGHSSGKVEDKTTFIANATNGRSVWKSISFKDVTNKVTGHDAISRFTLVGETESEGKTTPINIGVLMVWREEDDHWKLLARQAYKL